jgi:hypothetical protein
MVIQPEFPQESSEQGVVQSPPSTTLTLEVFHYIVYLVPSRR